MATITIEYDDEESSHRAVIKNVQLQPDHEVGRMIHEFLAGLGYEVKLMPKDAVFYKIDEKVSDK